MKNMFILNLLLLICLIAGCPNADLIEDRKISNLQTTASKSTIVFKETAKILFASNITWANSKHVSYLSDKNILQSELWSVAKVDIEPRSKLKELFSSHNLQSVFLTKERINFILQSAGIAPSGSTLGVFVMLHNGFDSGCTSFVSTINSATPEKGIFCVQIDSNVFFYFSK